MKLLDRMEKKFGRYAIRELPMIIIGTYLIGYILSVAAPNILMNLTLEPYYIVRGQIWRLVTWVFIPPSSLSIFTIIMLYFYYSVGKALERTWGAFRFNVYILGGFLFTVLGAFLLYAAGYVGVGYLFSTYYINMSILLAFAFTYPNEQVLLWFMIPLKMKWLGILYGAFILYEFIRAGWAVRIVILASLLNFVIYFLLSRNVSRYRPKEMHRKQEFKREIRKVTPKAGGTKHKCAVCGRTELDGDRLEFRYCSKCNGNYEYCQDHLFTHEHVKTP